MTTGTTIYLMNNLDLGARQTNGIKTTGTDWTPIGTILDNVMNNLGSFEGNNYTITGVYVDRDENFSGLFGSLNTIQNLIVKDCYINGKDYTGGITGVSLKSMQNCKNINTIVKGSSVVGGVTGFSGDTCIINECSNNGKVYGNISHIGGVVGYAKTSSSIINCINYGNLEGKQFMGGIVGYAYHSTSIISCINKGNITSIAGVGANEGGIGGIVGHAAYIIKLCCNTGNVSGIGNSATGGICGRCVSGKGQDISLCYNSGEIRGDGLIGGISGVFGSQNTDPAAKEYNCYNKGRLINTAGLDTIGGVAASVSVGANVTNCYYLSGVGANVGVYKVGDGGDLAAQNSEAKATNVDLKTFEEFLTWIEQQ